MKKTILLSIITFLFLSAYSQEDIDKLMTKKALTCFDIEFNSTQLIEKYYYKNQFDSIDLILDYWEHNCGEIEQIFRTKILRAIWENNFSESMYDENVLGFVVDFKYKYNDFYNPRFYNYQFSYNKIHAFERFTSKVASELITQYDENSIEYLFCNLYSGNINAFFNDLQSSDKYNGTKIKEYYETEIKKALVLPEAHGSLTAGTWIPLGNASTLGVHPTLGFEFGVKYKKFTYNFTANVKFISSKNDYLVVHLDSLLKTDYFFGGYIGFDVEREFIRIKNNEFSARVGVGYDGFSVMETNKNDDITFNDRGKSINSFNFNIGIGYKYFYKNNTYLGIRGKYNIVQYKNTGGTNLSGNTITIDLIFGGLSNYTKSSKLSLLNYNY